MSKLFSTDKSIFHSICLSLVAGSIIYLFYYLSTSTGKNTSSTQQNKISENSSIFQVNEKQTQRDVMQQGGLLIINRHLREQFDDIIFSLQIPPHSPSQSNQLLSQLAEELTLSVNATQYLFDLFGRYKHYRKTIATIKQNPPTLGEEIDLDETYSFIKEMNKLQTKIFNQVEIDAFFSHDNQYAEQAFERLAIRQDLSLNQIEKDTLLQHQISQLSKTERNALQPSLDAKEIATKLVTSELINLNMSADINSRARETQEINQQWKMRVNDYKRFKKSLDFSESDDITVNEYLNTHFSYNEIKRLNVFLTHSDILIDQ